MAKKGGLSRLIEFVIGVIVGIISTTIFWAYMVRDIGPCEDKRSIHEEFDVWT